MNHQNYINYQSGFQNPIPNPQSDQFPSAPPDPSIFYSSDYSNNTYYPNDNHHHNVTVSNSSYDPNAMPLWYDHQDQTALRFGGRTVDESVYEGNSGRPVEFPNVPVQAVRFDDYGRPVGVMEVLKNHNNNDDQSVYAYNGGNNSRKKDQTAALRFDDYGRPITYGTHSRNGQKGSLDGDKIVKATRKVEENEDLRSGVQKFRVILLSEGGGSQGETDVLCQIGLDGIRILDPATSRTLKVHSLENVTKWEVLDSNIFSFWTKSSIDIDARRVRLRSNSYTTTNLLDLVAAASFQLKEMDGMTISEQSAEKKKGFPDWINLMKPGNEEKDHWVPDEASTKCTACSTYFGAFVRRHHCRNCGDIFCDKCTQGRIALTAEENAQQVRVCDQCMAEVTQRLSHVNEVAARASGFNRHEDLAKKLQEEMEKKRKTTGLKSNVPDDRIKEVECPTCTVHLQVEVPASGSKTIECSVCQHPFLVSAH